MYYLLDFTKYILSVNTNSAENIICWPVLEFLVKNLGLAP
jgi:hypothetical protein